MAKKTIIGIVGAIGSGKSRVASLFEKFGCAAIDADKISHQLLDTEAVKAQVLESFGPEVVGPSGSIDRGKLGAKVFEDAKQLRRLTAILHPEVLRTIELKISSLQENPDIQAIVLDVPLLMEVGWHKKCDVLVYVEACEKIRRKRLEKHRNLDKNQQKKRENLQISLDKKKEIATFIVENNSDVSDLAKQVEAIFSAIQVRR